MTQLSETYNWALTTPSRRDGWRAWAAHHLRQLAHRLDGAEAIRLDTHCIPPLPADEVQQCLRLGAKHGQLLLDELAKAAAAERLLARSHPRLFLDWGGDA